MNCLNDDIRVAMWHAIYARIEVLERKRNIVPAPNNWEKVKVKRKSQIDIIKPSVLYLRYFRIVFDTRSYLI